MVKYICEISAYIWFYYEENCSNFMKREVLLHSIQDPATLRYPEWDEPSLHSHILLL
jgi:hypothetical protein